MNLPTSSRRKFLRQSALAVAGFTIIPAYVLGGNGRVAPNDKITLGFIGCGKQAMGLGSQFEKQQDVQIVAASDVYSGKMEKFIRQTETSYAVRNGMTGYQGCKPYLDYLELLRHEGLDAVVISSPDHWHGTMGVRAAEAGKHIYLEKPLTLTIPEGRKLVAAVAKNGISFQTGSMQRSWKNFRTACELIRNGYIGEVVSAKVSVGGPPKPYDLPTETLPIGLDWDRWLGPGPQVGFNHQLAPGLSDDFWAQWRSYREFGGGGVTDWGAHMFDIVQWALGMDRSGPLALTPPDGKENPFLSIRYANGITVTHEDFGRGNGVRFLGTEGQIDISREHFDPKPRKLKKLELSGSDTPLYHSNDHYADWLTAIREGKQPVCDVETGHRSASVCNLINIAYELNRPLSWDPAQELFPNDREANNHLVRGVRAGNW